MDKQYIGGLYKKVGMATASEVVETQLKMVDLIHSKLTLDQIKTLVLTLFCPSFDVTHLKWLFSAAQDLSPGFGSAGIDNDVKILAASLIVETIREKKEFAQELCLIIEVAVFFGHRNFEIDENIVKLARDSLASFQMEYEDLEEFEEDELFSHEDNLVSAGKLSSESNLTGLWTPLKDLIENIAQDVSDTAESHLGHINKIVRHVSRLEEQNKTQWFAISKWSKTSRLPFSRLTVGDAATRAPFELSQLVTTRIGPTSAAALLYMAQSDVTVKSKKQKDLFSKLCTSSDIDWRKSWIDFDFKNINSQLTPILFALALANNCNDEDDWKSSFKREFNIDSNFEIEALDYSTQLFHEILVSRM